MLVSGRVVWFQHSKANHIEFGPPLRIPRERVVQCIFAGKWLPHTHTHIYIYIIHVYSVFQFLYKSFLSETIQTNISTLSSKLLKMLGYFLRKWTTSWGEAHVTVIHPAKLMSLLGGSSPKHPNHLQDGFTTVTIKTSGFAVWHPLWGIPMSQAVSVFWILRRFASCKDGILLQLSGLPWCIDHYKLQYWLT